MCSETAVVRADDRNALILLAHSDAAAAKDAFGVIAHQMRRGIVNIRAQIFRTHRYRFCRRRRIPARGSAVRSYRCCTSRRGILILWLERISSKVILAGIPAVSAYW